MAGRRWLPRPLPISWLLLGPALAILLLTTVAVSWTAFSSARAAVQRFERQLAAEIGRGLEAELQQLTDDVAKVVHATAVAARRGWLGGQRDEVLLHYSANQLRHHPALGFLAVGLPDGQLVGAVRDPEEGSLRAALVRDGRIELHYLSVADDLPVERAWQGPAFDVRERPSYRRAAQSLRAGWSPVARYQAFDTLGLGMSAPLLAADGSGLMGVVSADMSLFELSKFMADRFRDRAGFAFIAEPDGQLLAVSLPELLAQPRNGRALDRRRLSDLDDPRARALAPLLAGGVGQRSVLLQGRRHLLDLRRVEAHAGLQLLLGVVVEEDELQGSMWSQARGAALGVAVFTALGLALLALLLRRVQRHVRQMGEVAQAQADGQRDCRAREDQPVAELQTLARSFNRMSSQVQAVVSGLEAEVAARTAQLEAANAELARQVALDGLTQIANRRHFDTQLQRAWRRCQRSQRPLAVVLIDVDDFKAYNDHYGHPAGDEVLRQLARLLAAQARRPDDLAARYGGEEFALLLPDADAPAAQHAAEQLLQQLRALALPHARARAAAVVTASLGVAVQVPPPAEGGDSGASAEQLVADADRALYAAKAAGRNQVQLAASHNEK